MGLEFCLYNSFLPRTLHIYPGQARSTAYTHTSALSLAPGGQGPLGIDSSAQFLT